MFCCTTYFIYTLRLHLCRNMIQKKESFLHLSLLFIVELDQHFSMAVRCTPTSEHFVLQVIKLIHQCFIASYKLLKQIIGYISWKVSLVRIHPYTFFSSVVLHIFVDTGSDIHMVVLLQPFFEGFIPFFFSMFTVDTFQHWRRHVISSTVC